MVLDVVFDTSKMCMTTQELNGVSVKSKFVLEGKKISIVSKQKNINTNANASNI